MRRRRAGSSAQASSRYAARCPAGNSRAALKTATSRLGGEFMRYEHENRSGFSFALVSVYLRNQPVSRVNCMLTQRQSEIGARERQIIFRKSMIADGDLVVEPGPGMGPVILG